jgi:hypothetical protein
VARLYALEVAHWALAGEGNHERDDEPQPPDDPVVQQYDVQPRPALEAGPTTMPCLPTVDQLMELDADVLVEHAERVADVMDRRGIDG